MRQIPFALAVLMLIAAAAPRLAAQVSPTPDEKAVEQIVIDLGSADPAVRAAASKRLEQAGPDIVPVLQKYIANDDPEIAARIKAAISSYEWMRDGAIIQQIDRGSQGERLGLQLGDVIVKIDDIDVKVHTDLAKGLPGRSWKLYVWRAGHVLPPIAGKDLLGVSASNWEISRGGNDQSRGLAALGAKPPDFAEAYVRLRAAREHGMRDPFSQGILVGLAARELDRKYAATAYAEYRAPHDCSMSHYSYDYFIGRLPFNSPHTEALLKRYHDEPFSVELNHELEDWFARYGANGPMAEQLFAKPWPAVQGDPPAMHLYFHEVAGMLVRLQQRRYDEVLKIYDHRTNPNNLFYNRELAAFQAAVRDGRGAYAARLGTAMLGMAERGQRDRPAALWGFASAAAAGDNAAADAFLAGLEQLDPDTLARTLAFWSADAWNQPAAADRLRVWVGKRPHPAQPGRCEQITLARLEALPESTEKEFAAAIEGLDLARGDNDFKLTLLNGYLRFAKFDKARKAAMALPAARDAARLPGPRERALAVIDFAQAHAAELDGAWKALRGVVQVAAGRDGDTWALRCDGAVFNIDRAGAIQQYPGLVIPPAAVTFAYPHFRVTPISVAVLYPYGRRTLERADKACPEMTFIFDAAKKCWTPLAESTGAIDLGDGDHRETDLALAIRAAAKGYPPLPGAMPREHYETDGFFCFDGDIAIYVDWKTQKLTDLSAEIGRLAGRDRPAHVYRPERSSNPRLICSDCGVWAFDAETAKLQRIPLGLQDENVMICTMPESLYGRRPDGKILLGVAPQQGGQVFIVDPQTRAVQSTDGYCGLGPADWYGTHLEDWFRRDPQPATHALYLARMANKGN